MGNLRLVLGDQLDHRASVFDGMDRATDTVLMMEVMDEAAGYQHPIRLTLFFAAMRHFRDELRAKGVTVRYVELDDPDNRGSFTAELARAVEALTPERLIVTQPGDHRVLSDLQRSADTLGLTLEVREDRHFFCDLATFKDFASGRKELVMENFYRRMRRRHRVLMDDDQPVGGRWNFDHDNRVSLSGKGAPLTMKAPRRFTPDDTTRQVIELVRRRFGNNPGTLDDFDYPVTAQQARGALRDFIQHRLPDYGTYQDAMLAGQPYLFHARLSCVLNLKLLDPRAAIKAAINAYEAGEAPLNAVEGFVRQLLGWREFVRGVYWTFMPDYAERNALNADLPVPDMFWTGETEMRCIRETVAQIKQHAYAHHIQRLMVMGLFAQLLGVHPYKFHQWHMALYPDAIDWVSLPNTLGMSQYGDGGIVGTKPYVATGNYIDRMSDYCGQCRYKPKQAVGDQACPFTTLYWDFLARHIDRLQGNHRMGLQIKNLMRKSEGDLHAIRARAQWLKQELTRNVSYPL